MRAELVLASFNKISHLSQMTAFPQNTIGQILDSERAMVLTAPERFGEHYVVAQDCVLFRDAVLEVVGR